MRPKFEAMRKRCQENKTVIEFDRRPQIYERITGYVLNFSDSLILLHVLEWNTFALNGYIVIRELDLKRQRIFNKDSYWQSRMAKKNRFKPVHPRVSIVSLLDVISTADKSFPLIAIENELVADGKRWVGKLAGFTSKTITIHDLNPNAEWIENSRFKLNEITSVAFGGGYETALALFAKVLIKN
jgi:hypothetical protein